MEGRRAKGSPRSENTGDAGRLAGMTAGAHVTSSENMSGSCRLSARWYKMVSKNSLYMQ